MTAISRTRVAAPARARALDERGPAHGLRYPWRPRSPNQCRSLRLAVSRALPLRRCPVFARLNRRQFRSFERRELSPASMFRQVSVVRNIARAVTFQAEAIPEDSPREKDSYAIPFRCTSNFYSDYRRGIDSW